MDIDEATSDGPLIDRAPLTEVVPPIDIAATPVPPRIWPSLTMPWISLVCFFLASIAMLIVAYWVVHGELNLHLMLDSEAMQTVSASRVGLILIVLVPQLVLVMPSILAAMLSPVPTDRRLSLLRGHWPYWAWAAAAMTTPLVGWISSACVSSLMEESEAMKSMSDLFREHGESGFLIPLVLLIGATPAVCEELLFRGYVQTRLNQRLGPAIGILLSSTLFALFHMDWVHSIAVFPLGVYLGVITWRSGSLIPAMLGHFVNNSISVVAVVSGPESMDQNPTPGFALFLFAVVSAGLMGAALTALAIWRFRIGHLPLQSPLPADPSTALPE